MHMNAWWQTLVAFTLNEDQTWAVHHNSHMYSGRETKRNATEDEDLIVIVYKTNTTYNTHSENSHAYTLGLHLFKFWFRHKYRIASPTLESHLFGVNFGDFQWKILPTPLSPPLGLTNDSSWPAEPDHVTDLVVPFRLTINFETWKCIPDTCKAYAKVVWSSFFRWHALQNYKSVFAPSVWKMTREKKATRQTNKTICD